jgi:uncharacterized protein
MSPDAGDAPTSLISGALVRAWRFPRARVLLFAKAPVTGAVKTRMIPALGADGAMRLHRRLLRDTLARLLAAGVAPLELWCAPDTGHPLLRRLAETHGLTLRQQLGQDLGARLLAASADALGRAEIVALVGSDCPELDADYLAQAFGALQSTEVDAVLGPAEDGGYVLLALRRAEPALFTGIPWGGDQVAAITRERMTALGWRWEELPTLRDVDRPQDLAWYQWPREP